MGEADAWVDRLDAKLRLLAPQPLMGRSRDELSPGVRSLPFGRYVIFYLPLADGIDVVRVLHSARSIRRHGITSASPPSGPALEAVKSVARVPVGRRARQPVVVSRQWRQRRFPFSEPTSSRPP